MVPFARRIPRNTMQKMLRDAANYEQQVKTGLLDEQIAVELVVIERIVELVQVVSEQVEQVVDLNSDLFDFLPFLFYSRK